MKTVKALFLLGMLCLPACRTQFQNVRKFDVTHDKCKAFVVIRQDWNYSLGFVDQDDRLILIKAELDVLGQMETIWTSPSGEKVIIESYGEGHQFISVYDVSSLVERYDQSKMIDPISTLDPYPYAFGNIRWINDDTIEYSSPSDFSNFDKELRRGKYSPDVDEETEHTWQWNIKRDKFQRVDSQR